MYKEKKKLTIYAIKARGWEGEEYVLANSIDEAISKYKDFYNDDYYRYNDEITAIRVAFEYEIID